MIFFSINKNYKKKKYGQIERSAKKKRNKLAERKKK